MCMHVVCIHVLLLCVLHTVCLCVVCVLCCAARALRLSVRLACLRGCVPLSLSLCVGAFVGGGYRDPLPLPDRPSTYPWVFTQAKQNGGVYFREKNFFKALIHSGLDTTLPKSFLDFGSRLLINSNYGIGRNYIVVSSWSINKIIQLWSCHISFICNLITNHSTMFN